MHTDYKQEIFVDVKIYKFNLFKEVARNQTTSDYTDIHKR